MIVQLRACMDLEGTDVVQCEESEADYFGVYQGDGPLDWIADFASYDDAREFADQRAALEDCEVEDLVLMARKGASNGRNGC